MQATIVPVAAIQHVAPGTFVFQNKPGHNSIAVQKIQTVSVTNGDRIQITSGLKPGDAVVVDGADRLRDGSKVRIVPDGDGREGIVNDGPGAPPGLLPNNARHVRSDACVKQSDQGSNLPPAKNP